MSLLLTLEETFMPGMPAADEDPSPREVEQWTPRYEKALHTMHTAGIETLTAGDRGLAAYIAARRE